MSLQAGLEEPIAQFLRKEVPRVADSFRLLKRARSTYEQAMSRYLGLKREAAEEQRRVRQRTATEQLQAYEAARFDAVATLDSITYDEGLIGKLSGALPWVSDNSRLTPAAFALSRAFFMKPRSRST